MLDFVDVHLTFLCLHSGNLHPTEGYAILPAMTGVGSAPGASSPSFSSASACICIALTCRETQESITTPPSTMHWNDGARSHMRGGTVYTDGAEQVLA
jgi:hypothetical protein